MDDAPVPTASCGLPPAVGDHIRIDRRATDLIPAGTLLRVAGVRPARNAAGWAYLDVLLLHSDEPTGEPWGSAEVLVPSTSVVVYRTTR